MKKYKISYLLLFFLGSIIFTIYQRKLIAIIFTILIHELGHLIILKIYKIKINEITLLPIGAYLKINVFKDEEIRRYLFIYSFGIFFNFIIAIIAFIANNNFLFKLNVGMIIFNIIPILPMDGFYILNYFICIFLPYRIAYRISLIINLFILPILLIFIIKYQLGIIFICYFGYFLLILIKNVRKRNYLYEDFLLKKHLNYNLKLKNRKNKYYKLPLLNNLFLGYHNYFYDNDFFIDENNLLNKRYGNVNNK